MSTKLAHITTQYKRFTKNQVLTESHLNEVLDYFDDQDRLTRICLNGVGIVCGFKVTCNSNDTIDITQGSGVTTDGDLFHLYQLDEETLEKIIDLEKITYSHYTKYENDKSPYKPFFYQDDNQIKLFELLTTEGDEETFSLAALQANEGISCQDVVVLLYLESYEKEQDLCVSLSCDNQGLEIIGNYKVLITTKAHAQHIKNHDSTISKTNFQHLFYQLPDVFPSRAILLKEHFNNYVVLKNKFADETLKNNLIGRIKQGYNILLNGLGMPQIRDIINLKLDDLFSFGQDNVPPDFQYRYDLLKDLIDTYNEVKSLLAITQASNCCADLNAFPKHLMLGEIEKTGSCFNFRHGFYKSPAITETASNCGSCEASNATSDNENTISELVIDFEETNLDVCYSEKNNEQHIYSLIKRTVLQLTNYNANYNYIKITPSRHLGNLSNKAIPFYYNVGNELISSWNFNKTSLNKHLKNTSYHSSLLDIKSPLKFNIDHDFYRIEGHQGMNYQHVISILTEIKRLNALSFNVIALPINATEAQAVVENYTSYYLNKNVGLEHKAGVTPGGTFIIFYVEGEYDAYPYPYGYGYPYGYPFDGGTPFGSDFINDDFDKKKKGAKKRKTGIVDINKPVEFNIVDAKKTTVFDRNDLIKKEEIINKLHTEGDDETVVLNPVVADFMLPYLCCDENIVELSLPVDVLCFTSETEPLLFEVSPKGGFVEAIVEEGFNGGVIRNNAGSFAFDPNLVSDELYGEPIHFKVNNLETNCEITVEPKVIFEVNVESIEYDRPNNTAEVTFKIIPTSIQDNQEFIWNFGDESAPETSVNLTIAHTYNNLDLLDEPQILVKTNAISSCSDEVATLVIFDIIPEAFLDKTTYCRNDETRYPFTIVPDNVSVLIEGEGVVEIAGKFFFVPALVSDTVTSLSFLVNGEPSGITVNIAVSPVAMFDHVIEDGKLILSNKCNQVSNYTWDVAGEIIERNSRNKVVRTIEQYDSNTIFVSITAHSKDCGSDLFGPIRVTIREDQEFTCEEKAGVLLDNSINNLIEIRSGALFNRLSDQTRNLFNQVLETYQFVDSKRDTFLNGENNEGLVEIFDNLVFTSLFNNIKANASSFDVEVLGKLSELEIKLFYTILGCQERVLIDEFIEQINFIQKNISTFLQSLKEIGVDIDSSNNILDFLKSIEEHFSVIDSMNNHIKVQIDALS